MQNDLRQSPPSLSRRRALKAGAIAAIGVTVWAEPTIKGIARRPAYASSTSGASEEFDFDTDPPVSAPKNGSTTVSGSSGSTLTITRQGSNWTFAVPDGTISGTVSFALPGEPIAGSETASNEASPWSPNVNFISGNPNLVIVTGNLTCT